MLAPPLVDLIILSLGIWRFSALLSYERGPSDMFAGLRARMGIGHDDDGTPVSWPDTFLAGLFSCVWCLSVWIAILMAIVYWARPEIARGIMFPFALSAGAVLMESVSRGH